MRRIPITLLCGAFLLAPMLWQGPALGAELALRDEILVQSPDGRQVLKYLVSCALPADVTVVAEHGGQRYSFPGGAALAPAWSTRALSAAEERLVSACMLARTNFFGKPVEISMRNDAP